MINGFEYIELSFIKNSDEIERQIKNTIAINYLSKKGFKPTTLSNYLDNTQYGYTASANLEGTHKLLRITDIVRSDVEWQKVPHCDCLDAKKYLLKSGDILVARTGGTTGKSFLIKEVPSNAIFASYLIRLRTKKNHLPEFINIFLNSYAFWSQISELKSGSAQPNVNAEKLKTLIIPECSIDIQNKIMSALTNGNKISDDPFINGLKIEVEEITKKLKIHDKLKINFAQQHSYIQLLRDTILQEAVHGKLTKQNKDDEPAEKLLLRIKAEKQKLIAEGKIKKEKELPPITADEIPFELPEGWVWCRLGELIIDLKYGTSQKCDYKKAKHAVLRIPNISKGVIDFFDLKFANLPNNEFENLKLEVDDLLIVRSNGSEKLVGRTAVFKGCAFDCAYAGYLVRLRFNTSFMCPEYIHLTLESNYARTLIEFPLRTTSGVKNINSTEISTLLVPLPSLSEQALIVSRVGDLMQIINNLMQQLQQTEILAGQLLQALLNESFTNKRMLSGI